MLSEEWDTQNMTSILLVRIPADRNEMQRVMKCKEDRGNTFNCDCSCAACHTKLVSCHTGVRTSVWFGGIPYAKVTIAQNRDSVVKDTHTKHIKNQQLWFRDYLETEI